MTHRSLPNLARLRTGENLRDAREAGSGIDNEAERAIPETPDGSLLRRFEPSAGAQAALRRRRLSMYSMHSSASDTSA